MTNRTSPANTPIQELARKIAERVPLGGPIAEFEAVGRLQLEVLVHEGLYPHSKVLDVGCGALRGGYWLMHFLDPGCYYGIEPYREMLAAGLEHLVGPDTVARKRPTFDDNTDFDLSVFGVRFDFVIARSIWTHATMGQIERMLDSFTQVAAPGGVMVASYFRFPPTLRSAGRFSTSMLLSRRDLVFRRFPGLRDTVARRLGDRLAGHARPAPEGAGDECLPSKMVAHTFGQVRRACESRGLRVRELRYGVVNSQSWLRVDAPPA